MIQERTSVESAYAAQVDKNLALAIEAACEKKALNLAALDLRAVTSFADFFLICSGTSMRHVQAICDAVIEKLKEVGTRPLHVEGYAVAEWILIDFGHLIVNIFSEKARAFYDLERLWRDAARIEIPHHDHESEA